jgi:hypothetical protein
MNRSAWAGSAANPAGADGGSLPPFVIAKSPSLAPPHPVSPRVSLCSLGCKMQPRLDVSRFIQPLRSFAAS